jgi:hypothetical protein
MDATAIAAAAKAESPAFIISSPDLYDDAGVARSLFFLTSTLAWRHRTINRADTAATQQMCAVANRLAKRPASPHDAEKEEVSGWEFGGVTERGGRV